MANKSGSSSPEGPEAKCCLGMTYFDRTLQRSGAEPKCVGLAQLKNGEQTNDDVRVLSDSTGDFKYYCIGYSSYPTGNRPSGPGKPTQMPFCEGVEIALTEDLGDAAPAAGQRGGGAVGPAPRNHAAPILDSSSASVSHPATAAASSPSASCQPEEDPRPRARFRRQLHKNAETLRAAITGEKFPQLPIPLRKHESFASVRQTFAETASANLSKMRAVAEFISSRTVDAVKPIWERLRSGEEAE